MKVVLDSNIIISDFWMQSPSFKILLENSKKGEIELIIPKVVAGEVINKFNQRIEKFKTNITDELSKFEKLSKLTTGYSISEDQITAIKKKFIKHFEKTLIANNVTILDYPSTSHEYLAKKAMLKLKPFNVNEKGYRDCLIWENIKSIISREDQEIAATPELIFITNNHTDFCSNDNQLHEDLVLELNDEGFNDDSVIIYPTLSEFNDKIAKLFFVQANIFEGKLKNNEFWDFELKSTIDDYLFKNFLHDSLDHYYSIAPYANDNPTVSTINDDFKLDTISVRKLNSKEYIVDVKFNLEVEIDYFINKSDYWSNDNIDVFVIDSEWNDYVVAVSASATLPIEMTLLINSQLECESIEITKIGDNYES